MRSKADRDVSACVVSFGAPLVFLARGDLVIGALGVVIFFIVYLCNGKIKTLRKQSKWLDKFVFSTYILLPTFFLVLNKIFPDPSAYKALLIFISGILLIPVGSRILKDNSKSLSQK